MDPQRRQPRRFRSRRRFLLAGWLVATLFIVGRAAQVQVLEGSTWSERAERQQSLTDVVPAPRGTVVDRNGIPLAASRERLRITVVTDQIRDPDLVRNRLVEVLGLSRSRATRIVRSDDPWIPLPGRFSPSVREELAGERGLHFERVMERFRPSGELGSKLLGRVGEDGGEGGIEQSFDSVLAGTPGRELMERDGFGQVIPGKTWVVEPPVPGGEVVLTLDLDLQEIARDALMEAIVESEARGGDLVALDPYTGEVLALVSIADGEPALSAITAPYEPGSTLKPFTVAAILEEGVARLSDTIDTEEGHWRIMGRTISDLEARGRLSLADALRYSSNVGVAKAAEGLRPGEQYQALRDFGFGVPTGIRLPGEAGGRLRKPREWSGQSKVSLSIGYEIAVTPLQMAAAYAVLANGGRLLQPRLVREIRPVNGRVRRFDTQRVRQAVSRRVARRIGRVLEQVVEEGTGTAARLSTYRLAGKSGTSRAWSDGGYQPGDYFASFAGFFPADDPQVVLFVKLDRPQGGSYYGGSTAAPVLRAVIQGLLATGAPPVDRAALARSRRAASAPAGPPVRFASTWSEMPTPAPRLSVRRDPEGVRIPDIRGLSIRVAARRLHAYGFRVLWESAGTIRGTNPPAGDLALPGDTVRILTRRVSR